MAWSGSDATAGALTSTEAPSAGGVSASAMLLSSEAAIAAESSAEASGCADSSEGSSRDVVGGAASVSWDSSSVLFASGAGSSASGGSADGSGGGSFGGPEGGPDGGPEGGPLGGPEGGPDGGPEGGPLGGPEGGPDGGPEGARSEGLTVGLTVGRKGAARGARAFQPRIRAMVRQPLPIRERLFQMDLRGFLCLQKRRPACCQVGIVLALHELFRPMFLVSPLGHPNYPHGAA